MTRNIPGKTVIGKVYNAGSLPTTTNVFYMMHPVTPSGIPSEGGTPTLTVDTSHSFPCFIIGPKAPVVDEYYLCHLSDTGFWFGERMKAHTTGTVTLPGCSCNIPTTLNLHWAPTNCDTTQQNYPQQDSTLTYVTTPSWASSIVSGAANIFMSNSGLTDINGDTYYYWMSCSSGVYFLKAIYQFNSVFGDPHVTGTIVAWAILSNTCSPFSMTVTSINNTNTPKCTTASMTG